MSQKSLEEVKRHKLNQIKRIRMDSFHLFLWVIFLRKRMRIAQTHPFSYCSPRKASEIISFVFFYKFTQCTFDIGVIFDTMEYREISPKNWIPEKLFVSFVSIRASRFLFFVPIRTRKIVGGRRRKRSTEMRKTRRRRTRCPTLETIARFLRCIMIPYRKLGAKGEQNERLL